MQTRKSRKVLCFESSINAEDFARKKSAIFLILPEEDPSKNFMAGLMIQQLSRELFAVADENGGKLQNRVVFFCDELGTMPPFDILPLFSAGRSRKLTLVPIIQSLSQLEKNYGKEGSEILQDNCQDTIFGGFAPNSQTAEVELDLPIQVGWTEKNEAIPEKGGCQSLYRSTDRRFTCLFCGSRWSCSPAKCCPI